MRKICRFKSRCEKYDSEKPFYRIYKMFQDLHVNPETSCKSCEMSIDVNLSGESANAS